VRAHTLSQVRNPLDPFLNKLAREYVDDDDLTSKMHRYFEVGEMGLVLQAPSLLVLHSGNLSSAHTIRSVGAASSEPIFCAANSGGTLWKTLQFRLNSMAACFQEVDVDGSGFLSYKELCQQLRKLDFTPPIHITMIDYDVITQVWAAA
jgi:hypothetical protein